ncbi:MAG: zf-HC2 domain-containing protein [Gemmatimonadaceae bacterium]|nr:zf-HC2 domain-containing protein [Gemmatimonadaceae bacterium]
MTDRMMTCASVDDLLVDILEGDVSAETGAAVDAHVSECARCTALLREIGHVRESAAALPDLAPSSDLWKGIAARIETPVVVLGERKQIRRFASPLWMAAAASLLVVASSGVTYWATTRSIEPVAPASVIAAAPAVVEKVEEQPAAVASNEVESVSAPVSSSRNFGRAASGGAARLVSSNRRSAFAPDTVFGSEIARLQRVIAERRSELDPQTVNVVEMNLKLIDAAIRSSRAALAKDPASRFLNQQLTRTLDKKVELLRTVALMPSST